MMVEQGLEVEEIFNNIKKEKRGRGNITFVIALGSF